MRVLVIAGLATLVSLAVWPEGAERVARGAALAVGAALVTDLVLKLSRSFPTAGFGPFAPLRARPAPAWRPQGLTDLQRDIRLLTVPAAGRRLPLSTRLRATCWAAAQRRLEPLGLDLDDPDDAAAAEAVLGSEAYAFIVGDARVAPIEELLAAVDPGPGSGPERTASA